MTRLLYFAMSGRRSQLQQQ